jgi:GNAT superfamily N-acetyltransferase
MIVSTALPEFVIRGANCADSQLLLGFIKELAQYEKLSHEAVATSAILEQNLFGERPYAEVLIAEFQGQAIGYALFFHSFSTFTGRPGIYVEDIYVQPQLRGKGFGKCLMSYIARLAIERNCSRMEWSVLDWNEPSIQFYRSIGAVAMDGWSVQRLDGAALGNFAAEFKQGESS